MKEKDKVKEKVKRFKATSFNLIKIEEISWLWKPYFPLGAITCITGDPGVGKSFISIFLASILSVGGKFPFSDNSVDLGNVIIQNSEDLKGATIKKRLDDCGADSNNIYVIELNDENDVKGDLMLKDIDELEEMFIELNPKMIVFDPITNFLGGDIDVNQAGKIRPYTSPIAKLAQKYNCSVVFIIHRNKSNSNSNPLHRMMGSVDWGAIARSVISVGKKQGADEVLFMHTKSNLSEKGKTLAFRIDNGVINWLGERDYITDDDLINNDTDSNNQSKLNEAINFIIEFLKEKGECSFKDMVETAINENISERTLNRARDNLKNNEIILKKYKANNICLWYINPDLPNIHL